MMDTYHLIEAKMYMKVKKKNEFKKKKMLRLLVLETFLCVSLFVLVPV